MMKNKLTDLLFLLANALLLCGALMQLFWKNSYTYILFGAGALVLLFLNLKNMSDLRDADVRVRRLSRNGVFSAFILAIGAYFMYTGSNSWVIALLIYALTTLFLTFRQPQK